jgi:hypothetical protein
LGVPAGGGMGGRGASQAMRRTCPAYRHRSHRSISIAHVIQVALTPVFLLCGIATLLKKEATVASALFTTFGLAVVCTIGAISAFTAEMLMAGSGMCAEVAAAHQSSQTP